jgi:hypothetical protein
MISLGSIPMLLWGLAIAIPIVLHFLRKRKSRTVTWGAMRFLQAAANRKSKRFQLWRLLLLMLRIAIIALLAIGVARPLFFHENASNALQPPATATVRIMVFDRSASMTTSREGQTRFERAQDAATKVVQNSVTGDGFVVGLLEDRIDWIGSGVSFRSDEIINEIRSLQPGEGTAELTTGVLMAEQMLESVFEAGWIGNVEVWWFSDLQVASWEVAPVQQWKAIERKGAGAVTFLAVDCSATGEPSNFMIPDFSMQETSTASSTGEFEFISYIQRVDSIRQADDSAAEVLVQLFVDERIEQSQRVELAPSKSSPLVWLTKLAPGDHLVEVRIAANDSVLVDNTSRRLVTANNAMPIALFGESRRDTRYLELAASPEANGQFEIQTFAFDDVARSELGREQLWVLCDPSRPDERAKRRIDQHIEQGGGVVWWLGPNWERGTAEAAFTGTESLRWSAQKRIRATELQIDPLEYASPFVAAFEPFPGSGLLTLPVFQFWKLELGEAWEPALGVTGTQLQVGQTETIIASLSRPAGGREVIVATPPGPGTGPGMQDEPWNAWIAWPAFVPLVQEIFRWAGAGETPPTTFLVGQSLEGLMTENRVGTRLVGDSGDFIDVNAIPRTGSTVAWSGRQTRRSGAYRWADGKQAGSLAGVVNVDPTESFVFEKASLPSSWTTLTADRVDAAFSIAETDPTVDSQSALDSQGMQASTTQQEAKEYGWSLLLSVIGLLVGESVLLRWMESRF